MNPEFCPVCYAQLAVREVTPCWVCGGEPEEVESARSGEHHYAWLRLGERHVLLCSFCQEDFGSDEPTWWQADMRARPGCENLEYVHAVAPQPTVRDKFCDQCGKRLAYLKFIQSAGAHAKVGT
jgi:hypothetical protein